MLDVGIYTIVWFQTQYDYCEGCNKTCCVGWKVGVELWCWESQRCMQSPRDLKCTLSQCH